MFFGALVLLGVGIAVRLIPGMVWLFAGTILLGGAIAFGNVLLPSIIKRDFAGHTGLMTGLYTMALSGGAALSAGLTIPIQRAVGLDWRYSIAVWGILVLAAMLVGFPNCAGEVRASASCICR